MKKMFNIIHQPGNAHQNRNGGTGSYRVMGPDFQFVKMKTSWR